MSWIFIDRSRGFDAAQIRFLNSIVYKSKNRSPLQITENSQSRLLSQLFNVNFKALVRPEYHVDAILPVDEIRASILNDLDNHGIEHRIDQSFLVVPNINTTEIGQRIRSLLYRV